jgi:hypothetical protein
MARFQFLLSSRQAEGMAAVPPEGRFRRLKALVGATLIASAFIGVLLAAVFLGLIFAGFLVILVAVIFSIAVTKAAIRGARR